MLLNLFMIAIIVIMVFALLTLSAILQQLRIISSHFQMEEEMPTIVSNEEIEKELLNELKRNNLEG
ncbi:MULTISPECIES: hypothetical protein [Sporosarcina]|uniref:Uncharacterized protein n=1 Tax=Sporosarcina contaminans TaxID=633403 RepID=A0ABW3U017_9BACL